MNYSLGVKLLMHAPRVRAALTRSLSRTNRIGDGRGVRHRQGPRVQHRPAEAGVRHFAIHSSVWLACQACTRSRL